ESTASYLKVCALLVPREMKVEHGGGVKAMTDEQIEPPGRRTPVRCRSGSHRYATVSVLDAKMRMRFWAVCLLAFELLLPPTRFSARLVSASWLVIFVHLVRCSGIVFISNHRADLPAMVVLALKSCLITIMAPSRPAPGTR